MRQAVTAHMATHAGHALMQIDIQNAFGAMRREELSQRLLRQDSVAAHESAKWPQQDIIGWYLCGESKYEALVSSTGVPQGDPHSTLLFAWGLSFAIAEVQDACPDLSLSLSFAMRTTSPLPVIDNICAKCLNSCSKLSRN